MDSELAVVLAHIAPPPGYHGASPRYKFRLDLPKKIKLQGKIKLPTLTDIVVACLPNWRERFSPVRIYYDGEASALLLYCSTEDDNVFREQYHAIFSAAQVYLQYLFKNPAMVYQLHLYSQEVMPTILRGVQGGLFLDPKYSDAERGSGEGGDDAGAGGVVPLNMRPAKKTRKDFLEFLHKRYEHFLTLLDSTNYHSPDGSAEARSYRQESMSYESYSGLGGPKQSSLVLIQYLTGCEGALVNLKNRRGELTEQRFCLDADDQETITHAQQYVTFLTMRTHYLRQSGLIQLFKSLLPAMDNDVQDFDDDGTAQYQQKKATKQQQQQTQQQQQKEQQDKDNGLLQTYLDRNSATIKMNLVKWNLSPSVIPDVGNNMRCFRIPFFLKITTHSLAAVELFFGVLVLGEYVFYHKNNPIVRPPTAAERNTHVYKDNYLLFVLQTIMKRTKSGYSAFPTQQLIKWLWGLDLESLAQSSNPTVQGVFTVKKEVVFLSKTNQIQPQPPIAVNSQLFLLPHLVAFGQAHHPDAVAAAAASSANAITPTTPATASPPGLPNFAAVTAEDEDDEEEDPSKQVHTLLSHATAEMPGFAHLTSTPVNLIVISELTHTQIQLLVSVSTKLPQHILITGSLADIESAQHLIDFTLEKAAYTKALQDAEQDESIDIDRLFPGLTTETFYFPEKYRHLRDKLRTASTHQVILGLYTGGWPKTYGDVFHVTLYENAPNPDEVVKRCETRMVQYLDLLQQRTKITALDLARVFFNIDVSQKHLQQRQLLKPIQMDHPIFNGVKLRVTQPTAFDQVLNLPSFAQEEEDHAAPDQEEEDGMLEEEDE